MLTNSRLISPDITGNNPAPVHDPAIKQPRHSVKIDLHARDKVSFSGSQGKGKSKRHQAVKKLNSWLHPKPIETKLIEAATNGQAKELEKLLNKTHQIYVRDWMGNTLLHHAALSGNEETVFLLLCKSLNPYTPNNYGQTAIDFSATDEIKSIFRNEDCHETRRQGNAAQREQREAEELTNRGIQPPSFSDYF